MPGEVKWGISLLIGGGLIFVGWKVPIVMNVIFVMVCFVLTVVVLLQSGKAADLAGAFGGAGSQTAFGPRGAATFLSKATTWCAIMFMLMALAMTLRQDRGGASGVGDSELFKDQPKQSAPAAPQPPAGQPAPGQAPTQQPPAQQTPPAKK